jgi:acetyl-CoA carboxylase, biotin carboxylase subunit
VIHRLLVANRGEIAVRILRACRDLDITGIAVFSDADRSSMHVRYADEAYNIGPPPAVESYLNIERILDVAKACNADAIHPGYGFLAENPEFADACDREGITFVGPSARAMRLLGDKVAARNLMKQAGLPAAPALSALSHVPGLRRLIREGGVPLVPGSAEIHDLRHARSAARSIGYPLLIKAAAGGGGRGIRTVRSESDLASALSLASEEARAAFGNPAVYLEKLLSPVRHVEVQIIADTYGNIVTLNERECSLQRRHQKLIEESPSPVVTEDLRRRLNAAAILAARSADYVNAGTVEFLLDSSMNFYFIEMNTRLQVEHPVTEMVTGFDLVTDQIRIASGFELGYAQSDVVRRGWAIECRIVAEDARVGFLPSIGEVEFVREPAGPGIRVESALYDGFEVSPFYDSLIAKVTAWGRDRREAIRRMRRALGEFRVTGVQTNIPMHMEVMRAEEFLEGEFNTTFLETALDYARTDTQDGDEEAALTAAAILAYLGNGNGQSDPAHAGGSSNPRRANRLGSPYGVRHESEPSHGWRSRHRG